MSELLYIESWNIIDFYEKKYVTLYVINVDEFSAKTECSRRSTNFMTDIVYLVNASWLFNAISWCYVLQVVFGYQIIILIFSKIERELGAVKLPFAPQK